MRHYFMKHGAPVWIHVPGTPFTIPGVPASYQRRTVKEAQSDTRGYPLGRLSQALKRKNESQNVSNGLLTKQVLPQPNSRGILSGVQSQPSVLEQLPQDSATEATPRVITTSNTGV